MSRNGGRQCKETNDQGRPCRSPIVLDSGFCPAHDPDNREEFLAQASRGGQVTKRMFEGLAGLPDLQTPDDAQEWLARISRLVAMGQLSGSAAKAAISGVREWLKAYRAGEQAQRIERLQEQVEALKEQGVLG